MGSVDATWATLSAGTASGWHLEDSSFGTLGHIGGGGGDDFFRYVVLAYKGF